MFFGSGPFSFDSFSAIGRNVTRAVQGLSLSVRIGTATAKGTANVTPEPAVCVTAVAEPPELGISNRFTVSAIPQVTSSIGSVTPEVKVFAPTLTIESLLGDTTQTAVEFDFNAVQDDFGRDRVVYVPRQSTDRTVTVPKESRVVYVARRSTSAERTAEAA